MAPLQQRQLGLCFLLEDFYPIVNGAAIQIMLVAERLVMLGMRVTIITRQIRPEHSPYERINGVDIFRVKPAIGLRRAGKYLMLAPAFLTMLKQRKQYDVIIACNMRVLGLLAVVAGRFLRKKSLLRAECCGELDGSFVTQFGPPPSTFKLMMVEGLIKIRNLLLLRADRFLSISSAITKEFLSCGVSPKAVIEITNGIDVERFAPVNQETKRSLRKKLGLTDRKYFLYTGRLGRGKGLEYLLETWKRFISQCENVHLLLVGSGTGQAHSLSCDGELRAFIRDNKIEDTITFTGNVENINEYLQAGDFYILPSRSEGLSIALIEALSCGLPCITTSVGGNTDVVEDGQNGILVPYRDEHKLFEAMKELVEDSARAVTLGRKGRDTVVSKFNIDKISAQYFTRFNDLAEV